MPTHSRVKWLGLLAIGIILLIALAFLSSKLSGLQVLKVEGRDMEPTLHENDRIVVTGKLGELQRRDIVIFKRSPEPLRRSVKRIVALPGELVEIREGTVYVDGKALAEDYVDSQLNRFPINKAALRIPEDSYYVLGDNRDNSNDSRFWGPLPRGFIDGTVLFHY